MKRLWMSAGLAFVLLSCSSSSSSSTVACVTTFWNDTFATCLPAGWKTLSSAELHALGVPEETTAAFQVTTPHAGQFDTVTVTQEQLPQDMTPLEYSQGNIMAVSALPDYKMLDKATAYVDGKETALHVFTARPSTDTPIRRYYQLSAVQNRTGYTFTGSFGLGITDAESTEVQFILKNVSFVNPNVKK